MKNSFKSSSSIQGGPIFQFLPVNDETSEAHKQASIAHFFPSRSKDSNRKSKSTVYLSEKTNLIKNETSRCIKRNIDMTVPKRDANKMSSTPSSSSTKTSSHYIKTKAPQQTYLDFGQKNFGKKTCCHICGMLYDERLEEDSRGHSRICTDFLQGVPFQVDCPRVVASFASASFIAEIRPTDNNTLRRKVCQVRAIVESEMGFASDGDEKTRADHRWTFLYVQQKRVIGMVVAERIQSACRLCENRSVRGLVKSNAMVGIYMIWVHSKFRRRGIASRLVDAVRERMLYGTIIPRDQLAFSSPTLSGIAFARKYCETEASNLILVYDCI